MASSLGITLANLASIAMESSIEWRPLLKEINLEFLDSSGVGSYWRFFLLGLHIFSILCDYLLCDYLLSRISIDSWFLGESYSENLDHHRGFGIAVICLCHDEGIGQ